jgi:ectoine hydroxylase-related dioxygenase (phytanoyl-CoA dioxygenase family)/putative sterol carrier protein
MQTATKPRPSKSTMLRVEERAADASDTVLDQIADAITTALGVRGPFAGSVEIRIDDKRAVCVAAGVSKTAAGECEADARVYVAPRELLRLVRDDLEPRQAVLFGQIKMIEGDAKFAVALFDHLAGRSYKPRTDSDRPLPAPTTDWAKAKEDLAVHGYALVKDALSPEQLKAVRERVVEQAAGELDAGCAVIGEATHRIWNLINKGRVFHDLLLHPVFEYFVPEYLGEHALMPSFSANIALPGNTSSIMHYDQISLHHKIGFPIGLNFLFFLDDVSDANGGTRLMPGSHREPIMPADPYDVSGTVAAAGPAGTVLLLDSRVWHSVGHNTTDKPRHVIVLNFQRSYIRSQENYFLSLLPEVEATLDERVRVMLGFRCTGSLGAVEGPIEGKMNGRIDNPVGELKPSAPVDH